MTPFEELITSLGNEMGILLRPDVRQSCKIHFSDQGLSIQIDLDSNADKILIGSEIGYLAAGPFREKVLFQAMKVNGTSAKPRGFLAYSKKKDSLVLFQFFTLMHLTGKELHELLLHFLEHAMIWKEALRRGEVPIVEVERDDEEHIFGLKK